MDFFKKLWFALTWSGKQGSNPLSTITCLWEIWDFFFSFRQRLSFSYFFPTALEYVVAWMDLFSRSNFDSAWKPGLTPCVSFGEYWEKTETERGRHWLSTQCQIWKCKHRKKDWRLIRTQILVFEVNRTIEKNLEDWNKVDSGKSWQNI